MIQFGLYKNPEEYLALLEMDSFSKIKNRVDNLRILIIAGLNALWIVALSLGKCATRLHEKNSLKY